MKEVERTGESGKWLRWGEKATGVDGFPQFHKFEVTRTLACGAGDRDVEENMEEGREKRVVGIAGRVLSPVRGRAFGGQCRANLPAGGGGDGIGVSSQVQVLPACMGAAAKRSSMCSSVRRDRGSSMSSTLRASVWYPDDEHRALVPSLGARLLRHTMDSARGGSNLSGGRKRHAFSWAVGGGQAVLQPLCPSAFNPER